MKPLTAKQKAFVDEYLVDLNATQAAIRAGYSRRTAYRIGSENLSKPQIAAAVADAQRRRSERVRITQDDVLRRLDRLGRAAEEAGNYTAAIRVEELRGKHLGMFRGEGEEGAHGDGDRRRPAIVYLPTPIPLEELTAPKALPARAGGEKAAPPALRAPGKPLGGGTEPGSNPRS